MNFVTKIFPIFKSVLKQFFLVNLITSCSPSIHLIDRQTILELEASGDWQELDQKFQEKELASGPLPMPKVKNDTDRARLFRMTHSDDSIDPKSKEKSKPKTSASEAR
jgi:hypothetical protein